MQIDPQTHDRSMYRTMTGTVVPRPIGWVSSTAEDGTDNLAPYSFFNVVSVAPPTVMFAAGDRPDSSDGMSDTTRNARATGEFVVNLVTHQFAEAMNESSAILPPDRSEFDHASLERAPSIRVDPPRVAGVDVAFECELHETQSVGSHTVVMGEVVYVHLDDGILNDEGKVDVREVDAVGRLAGSYYDTVQSRFRMERPD
jgi:flavin reductase (DIM6/NTAB) family NADH-FMN oxidoreductase RutF